MLFILPLVVSCLTSCWGLGCWLLYWSIGASSAASAYSASSRNSLILQGRYTISFSFILVAFAHRNRKKGSVDGMLIYCHDQGTVFPQISSMICSRHFIQNWGRNGKNERAPLPVLLLLCLSGCSDFSGAVSIVFRSIHISRGWSGAYCK